MFTGVGACSLVAVGLALVMFVVRMMRAASHDSTLEARRNAIDRDYWMTWASRMATALTNAGIPIPPAPDREQLDEETLDA